MNAVEIEEAISELSELPFDASEFPYAFLEAFGNPETTIKRLRKGESNRTDVPGAVLQRSNIHILVTDAGGVEDGLKALRESPKTAQQKAKFVLATDGEELQAEDLNSGEAIACRFVDFPKHFGFLLPLAGISTVAEIKNNPIDIKATGRLDKLYVALLEENSDWAKQENREDFNHFMAQLIFCFFAEDTGIFNGDDLFTATVRQMTESDGSNTAEVISTLFEAMNLDPREGEREGVRPYADQFPYVNGGLFGGKVKVPKFSRIARTYLLRAGDLDWTAINPDIFGSMIQAVADDDERGELGMHYTSVPNILKVLNPLFLDSLREDLEKAGENKQQLGKLKKRISGIRVFDPACGSGNFLVIAYKQMREIEHAANLAAGWGSMKSVIPLTNFRGIEIKSFAAEIARLALIIAEFQCDELYMGQREALALFLPLEKQNWITCGNALRLDWLSVCPPPGETSVKLHGDDLFETPLEQSEIDFENEGGEIFLCGNPPYLGSRNQKKAHKEDLKNSFRVPIKGLASLDYVFGWFEKASDFITNHDGAFAFVATNSICQGHYIPTYWPHLISKGVEIVFARRSFKWENNASKNAGVTVVVVGIGKPTSSRYIFDADERYKVNYINPYLFPSRVQVVKPEKKSISGLPHMNSGNYPGEGNHLTLNFSEYQKVAVAHPDVMKFLRPLYGASEYLRGKQRYCLWIDDEDLETASSSSYISERVQLAKQMRTDSPDPSLNKLANRPHQFRDRNTAEKISILAPTVSSENREYLPVGIYSNEAISNNQVFALYDEPLWCMSLLTSKLHIAWIATVCGKLKTDYRYSNTLGWNTFPVPTLTTRQKDELTRAAENILLAREAHFPATIADLYKPDAMPYNLRAAHDENDRILEEIYIGRRFKNDTERLETLFRMYTDMTSKPGGGER